MSKFDRFIKEILEGSEILIREMLAEYHQHAISATRAFVEETKNDLVRWTKLLAKEEITLDEFEWLLEGRKDLLEIHALKEAGLAAIRIHKFRLALFSLIIDRAAAIFI